MTACCVYARRKRADLSFKCPNPLRLLYVNSCWENGAGALHFNTSVKALRRQAKQKLDFKKRHYTRDPSTEIPEGSLVLMKTQARSKMHKGTSREGPFKLLEWCRPDMTNCILEDASGKRWRCKTTRVALFPTQK